VIEFLDIKHRRENFDCGKALLNNYFKTQAGQDIKRKLSACFVLPNPQTNDIQGYYTLSNNSIVTDSFPARILKKFPKSYTSIPTTLLGRLAIDKKHQGKGIGKILLIDALKRSYEISQKIGTFAVVVDPMEEESENFYKKYDFLTLPDSGKMLITIKTLKVLFG
jgi:GNAT superfamily N-acetyltransferase